jgi:small subunit ribosomal protein S20
MDVAEQEVRSAVVALDKAAKKGVIHKANASRRKSRIMKQLAAAKASS